MKSKIISLIVVLSLITVITPSTVSAEDNSVMTGTQEVIHLANLGILEGFTSQDEESIVTRAEFSKMVIRLLNLQDVISEPDYLSYLDVDSDYPYANEIYHLTKMGLFGGAGDGYFMPNAPLETNHALKVIVTALGYSYEAEAYGGYPVGYIQTAKKLDLLKGVDLKGDGLTFKGIIRLLYNSLFVDIMKITGVTDKDNIYTAVKGENILSDYFKLGYKKGIVDAVYGLSLGTLENLDMYDIAIDGTAFKTKEDYTGYLGYNVCALYSIKEENYGEIVSLSENSDKNNVLTIDFSDIKDGSLNTFTYEDANGKVTTKNIDVNEKIVYNRTLKFDFDFSNINNLKRGIVYLIDNTGDEKSDVVIIAEYKTYIVSSVTDKKITDRLNNPSIDISDSNRKVFVKDKENNIKDLNSITRNSVLLVIETPDFIEITISNEKVSGVLCELSSDEFKIDDVYYKVSPVIASEYYSLNKTYVAYLDPGGKIVLLETVAKDGYDFAYITKIKPPLYEEDYGWLKLFTHNGEFTEFEVKENIKVNGKSYKPGEFGLLEAQFEQNDTFIPQLVKVKYNEDGKLIDIRTARTSLSSTEDDFVMGTGEIKEGTELQYDITNPNFGGKVFVEKNTKMFLVPPYSSLNSASDDDYKIITALNLVDNTKYKVSGYYNSKENFLADTAVVYSLPENFSSLTNASLSAVFIRTYTGLDYDGYPVARYEFMTENGLENFAKACPDSDVSNLKKGDTLRIITSGDELVKTELVYRYQDGSFEADGTSKSYNSSIRFVKGKPSYINDTNIRLSYDDSVYEGSGVLNLEGFVLKGTILYIKVENTNGILRISQADIGDIDKESELLIQQYNGQVKMVVIYK